MTRWIWVLWVAAVFTAAGCGGSGGEPEGNAEGDEPAAAVEPAAPDASPHVLGFGDLSVVSLPAGDAGAVTIIEAAETIDAGGSVTTIVRNNTRDDIGRIEISGTARDASGALVGSGSSQGFSPAVVAPGEIAYGYVFFGHDIPTGSTFEFNVDSEPVGEYFLPVTITEINNTGEQIVGAVMNDLDVEVSGPISADVLCFDADGDVTGDAQSYVEPDDLPAGGTGSFAIDLFDQPCPVGIAAASGYSS